MKKIVIALFIWISGFYIMSITAYGESEVNDMAYIEGDFSYVSESAGKATLTKYNGTDKNVLIPETVGNGLIANKMKGNVFSGNKYVRNIKISKNMVNIATDGELFDTTDIERIEVSEGNKRYYDVDGVLFYRFPITSTLYEHYLQCYPQGRKDSVYRIPSDITNLTIMRNAFIQVSALEKIILQKNVKEVYKSFDGITADIIFMGDTVELESAFWKLGEGSKIVVKNAELEQLALNSMDEASKTTTTVINLENISDSEKNNYLIPATNLTFADGSMEKDMQMQPSEEYSLVGLYKIFPADATDHVTWKSTNEEIAKVDNRRNCISINDGNPGRPFKAGLCQIIGEDENGHSIVFNITTWSMPSGIKLMSGNGSSSSIVGDEVTVPYFYITDKITYDMSVRVYVTGYEDNPKAVTVTSSNPSVAVINSVTVNKAYSTNNYSVNNIDYTLKGSGTTVITTRYEEDGNVLEDSIKLTVEEPEEKDIGDEEENTEAGKGDIEDSENSENVTIERKSQNITFSSKNVKNSTIKVAYGKSAFNLGASAKTALNYSVSGNKVVTVDNKGKVSVKGTGYATITVTARQTDTYKKATKTIVVYVSPKQEKVNSLRSNKKSEMTLKWNKDTKATGYQIQYSTSSKFKSAKSVTVSSNKSTSKTIKKLSKGKKYYVRVRAYKTVKIDGKNVKQYGAWSNVKSVTVKRK